MKKGLFPVLLVAGALVSGCNEHMTYDELDATRVNAANAIEKVNSLEARVEELEGQVEELQSRLDEIGRSN